MYPGNINFSRRIQISNYLYPDIYNTKQFNYFMVNSFKLILKITFMKIKKLTQIDFTLLLLYV